MDASFLLRAKTSKLSQQKQNGIPFLKGIPFISSDLGFSNDIAAHVRSQDFRDHDTAVCLLIVFKNSGHRTSNSKAGPIEGVDKLRFGFAVTAEPNIGTTRLEIYTVGAGRDFTVLVLCGEPDFDVIAFGGREPKVTRAEANHMVWQSKGLKNPFGIMGQLSNSSKESSGLVNFTISTLWNWCWRIKPRVSRPALPASARKQGVKAVK